MRFPSFLSFLTKKAPERPPSDEPVSPIYVLGGQPIRFLTPAAAATADVWLKKNPQLYRITNFVSAAVQAVPWFCEEDPTVIQSEQAPPTKIKAINDLLRSPNDTFTEQQLRYWLTLNLMLYARAHFKVGLSSNGSPNGIYPLAAKYMKGVPNSRGTVERYEYGEHPPTILPTRRTAPPSSSYASEISFPSLSGLVEYNKTPAAIESISMPLAIIQALMQRAYDTASGHPNVKYIVTTEKTLTKTQRNALQQHFDEAAPGQDNSGNVLFMYNTQIEVHKLDNELTDIHAKLPIDDMTRQIAGVFGVPIALLGLGSADAAKYASNYLESRLAFWQDTIVPSYLSPIASGMTAAICPPGARVSFDLDAVPALWEGRATLGEKLAKVPYLTDGEKREILGFSPKPPTPLPTNQPAPAPAPPAPPTPPDTIESKVIPIGNTIGRLQ